MKILFAGLLAIGLVGPAAAPAQDYYGAYADYGLYGGYPYFGYYSSTPAEGYGRGLADLIRSQGIYNALSAAGAVQAEEARRKAIENYKEGVETYYHVRELNRSQRAAEREGRHERVQAWLENRQPYAPPRLSPTQLDWFTGEIHWPAVLRDPAYGQARQTLEQLFRQRTAQGGLEAQAYAKVLAAGNDLLDGLKSRIAAYRPMDYMVARRFVEALISEAAFAPS